MRYLWKKLIVSGCLTALTLMAGCARPVNKDSPIDPYEKINRKFFSFNRAVDSLVLRPVATAYATIIPGTLRKGVSNFFDNFEDVTTTANDVLQARFTQAYSDSWRVIFNSTIGIGGLFDVASHIGLHKHYEDFGLTMAYWGQNRSAYLDLPIIGPSTFRDSFGKMVDLFALSPWPYIRPMSLDYELYGVYLMDVRSQLLPANELIAQAFDPYVFVRDAYLQTRDKLVRDNETKPGGIERYSSGT